MPSLRAIEIAFGIAVAFHVTFSSGRSSLRPIVEARRSARSTPAPAVLLVRDPTPARADVARPMHPGLRRQRQLCVGVDPLRVVGCEHVRLDAERRQMARELQRPLHAAAA